MSTRIMAKNFIFCEYLLPFSHGIQTPVWTKFANVLYKKKLTSGFICLSYLNHWVKLNHLPAPRNFGNDTIEYQQEDRRINKLTSVLI